RPSAAIDVSASISRILSNVTGREHQRANNRLRQLLA
ncbi:type III secretion component protein HrcN, partial [Pseudomonas syringae pv. pisi str. 1704B]